MFGASHDFVLFIDVGLFSLAREGQADAGFNEFMTKLGELDPDVSKWWSTVRHHHQSTSIKLSSHLLD